MQHSNSSTTLTFSLQQLVSIVYPFAMDTTKFLSGFEIIHSKGLAEILVESSYKFGEFCIA